MMFTSVHLLLLAFLHGNLSNSNYCEGFAFVSNLNLATTRTLLRNRQSQQELSAVKHTISTSNSNNNNNNNNNEESNHLTSRRYHLATIMTSIGMFSSILPASPSNAFDNKISNQYDDRPKRHGPQPKDLGVALRKDDVGDDYQGLKPCGPAPNCFCSTDQSEIDPDHYVPAWKWPKGLTQLEAFQQLENVVKEYPPGQGNIDGGGFQIMKFDAQKGYMYIQFESLKAGYIDDVEFAVIDAFGKDSVQVRSSSRVGYLDFGVNAKRLNYIAKGLRDKGWDAIGVDYDTHEGYFTENNIPRPKN